MKNVIRSRSFFLGKEKERNSNILILFVGILLFFVYVKNATIIFDDLYIPRHYSDIVQNEGWLHAVMTIFTGGDLSREYRTYGFSRLMQFGLWSVFGGRSAVYPVLISLSQILTSLLILRLFRRLAVSEPLALFIALSWLVSPFFITWTFHHYSYLILPFQLLILTFYLIFYADESSSKLLLSIGLGVVCALTGEMHLPAAFLILFWLSFFSKKTCVRKSAIAALFSFLFALFLHRLNWVLSIRDNTLPQRFTFDVHDFDFFKLLGNVSASLYSISLSFWRQVVDFSGAGIFVGSIFATILIIFFLWCVSNSQNAVSSTRVETRAAFYLLLIGLFSFSLYVLIAVILGEKAPIMPRRYGYIPFTIIFIALSIFLAQILNLLSWPSQGNQRIGYAVALFCLMTLSSQFQVKVLKKQREIDANITRVLMQEKVFSEGAGNQKKSVLFFVASESKYWEGQGDGSVLGPKTDSFERRELFESPWGIYWTSKSYAVDFLGFEYSAMVSHCRPSPSTDTPRYLSCDSEWAYPVAQKKINANDAIVVANLSLEKTDPAGEAIRIFKNYAEFEPNNFSRRIERDALKIATTFSDDFSIDLGQKNAGIAVGRGVVVDKNFADRVVVKSDWIANYGLTDGSDGTYSHPDIRDDLASYKTNRNGAFSYQVEFKERATVEVSLDFWEQWGRKPGERVFTLEVSWDGLHWADVGSIDMAAINQDAPFSVILKRRDATLFAFRLKPIDGTKDVPVIQNIRLHKI